MGKPRSAMWAGKGFGMGLQRGTHAGDGYMGWYGVLCSAASPYRSPMGREIALQGLLMGHAPLGLSVVDGNLGVGGRGERVIAWFEKITFCMVDCNFDPRNT